ncbi:unnamed protein product [Prunus brigantina]
MDSLQNPNPERHRRSHASNVRPKISPLGVSLKKIGEDIAAVSIHQFLFIYYDFACWVCLGAEHHGVGWGLRCWVWGWS